MHAARTRDIRVGGELALPTIGSRGSAELALVAGERRCEALSIEHQLVRVLCVGLDVVAQGASLIRSRAGEDAGNKMVSNRLNAKIALHPRHIKRDEQLESGARLLSCSVARVARCHQTGNPGYLLAGNLRRGNLLRLPIICSNIESESVDAGSMGLVDVGEPVILSVRCRVPNHVMCDHGLRVACGSFLRKSTPLVVVRADGHGLNERGRDQT